MKKIFALKDLKTGDYISQNWRPGPWEYAKIWTKERQGKSARTRYNNVKTNDPAELYELVIQDEYIYGNSPNTADDEEAKHPQEMNKEELENSINLLDVEIMELAHKLKKASWEKYTQELMLEDLIEEENEEMSMGESVPSNLSS
jgi:hypothetical protein